MSKKAKKRKLKKLEKAAKLQEKKATLIERVVEAQEENATKILDKKIEYELGNLELEWQHFSEWDLDKCTTDLISRLHHICQKTISQAIAERVLAVYGKYPSHSKISKPSKFSEDTNWARLTITGKRRICGHIVDNVFHIVFLDKNHEFWPTLKRGT